MNKLILIIRIIFLLIILVISKLVISCSCQRAEELSRLPIEENMNKASLLSLSDYTSSIEYIPLQTPDNVLLAGHEYLALSPEYFITFGKECIVFNREGEFVRKISNEGRGPGEYTDARSSYLYPVNQSLYFPSTAYEKINVYTLENELIDEIIRPQPSVKVRNISENLFAVYRGFLYGDAEWNTMVYNSKGDSVTCIINKYRHEGTRMIVFNEEHIFYYFNDHLHLKEAYSDTIYMFNSEGQHIPKYLLDLGIFGVPASIKNNSESMWSFFSGEYFGVNGIYESDQYLIFKYIHNGKKNNLMIYHKKTGNIENFPEDERSGGIKNDVDGGPDFIPEHNDNNLFLQKINAFELKAFVATEEFKNSTPKYPEKKKELEALASSLDENDNPVLMLVKLKK
jgi:hypothetical protein